MPPRFVLGEDQDLREWLVHLQSPRFACRVAEDGEGVDGYEFESGVFTDFSWIDEEPSIEVLEAILFDAADFVEKLCP